ncbi:MAG: AAA family ATPase, CDC48 subfamily [Candidatus Bathyarchaeota archaeon B23]|nr:MAG: AAA family ATPase, CDC48 subfamily [Candidatus Bathyarchaeota archaeon B23]
MAEAKQQRDVGRGIARIDSAAMKAIGVTVGDVVEIIGKKNTAAKAWPAYPEDQGLGLIRIDGFIRKNCGVSINEFVTVRKANVSYAKSVKLAPVDIRISVDSDFVRFVKDRLIDRPCTRGDTILITMLGHSVPFTVVNTRPSGIVKIAPTTEITILSEPVPELEITTRTTYEDIGGLDEAIRRIREMVELPLRHPEIFQRLGIDPPKGVLLHGPPGCGKTLLARAVANESDANFYAINGPEIMSKFYGESEARLRKTFEEAERNAPSIIFIDEIDAIAPKRSEVTGEVERRVVAQLLALMDGLKGRGNVIVIGATNRPEALDPALRRPGRFDREIEIGIPDRDGRLEILQIHTRGMPLAEDVDLEKLADITHGYTGADLAALCREAAMKALRRYLPKIDLEEKRIPKEILDQMVVTMEDFLASYREITPTAMREVYIETPNVHWDDIGGLEEVKQRLKEAVEWPLKNPEAFRRMGITPPKGILLYGPPGCGKTLLARAVATESEANFISVRGPEIFSKWVGESEKAIREIFRKARMAAPSIIFFDEIDAIAPSRGLGFGDSRVTERVISQLLTEIDGLIALQNVVVIGATNRPDILDTALLRPGRFDRRIYVPPPDYEARLEILKIKTREMPLAEDVNLEELARKMEGYSGADIDSVCREAAINALRRDIDAKEVTLADFEEAMSSVAPSITPDMEKWYKDMERRFKEAQQKPIMAVA